MTRLSIAIPSKGRLKEKSEAWFAKSGFKLRQKGGGRGYSAELSGLGDVDVMLLSAREIATGLIEGQIHIGITGEDLLNDLSATPASDFDVLHRLGFGGADVIVAVPAAWLDVETMADLEAAGALFRERHGRRMRVATKYLNLTRRFFAERSVGEYRLVESAGATEAAPAAGSAEVIVDITSTGATLKANDLKILQDGVMLESQAALTASLKAAWTDESLAPLQTLLDAVAATALAQTMSRLELAKPVSESEMTDLGLTALHDRAALCPAGDAREAARGLTARGAGTVAITTVEQVFASENAVFEKFVKKVS
ncbi:MAG: ATP phosphoribosyltransferase [Hyphomonadaceae bacterium]|nr:ATP phosphoribosyltransferase [Hyphomonadaceae bacterium]